MAISLISVGVSGLLLLGCYVSATSLNYYARRYVGELSLVTQPGHASPALCFSVLDFWGNREVLSSCPACTLMQQVPAYKMQRSSS